MHDADCECFHVSSVTHCTHYSMQADSKYLPVRPKVHLPRLEASFSFNTSLESSLVAARRLILYPSMKESKYPAYTIHTCINRERSRNVFILMPARLKYQAEKAGLAPSTFKGVKRDRGLLRARYARDGNFFVNMRAVQDSEDVCILAQREVKYSTERPLDLEQC